MTVLNASDEEQLGGRNARRGSTSASGPECPSDRLIEQSIVHISFGGYFDLLVREFM